MIDLLLPITSFLLLCLLVWSVLSLSVARNIRQHENNSEEEGNTELSDDELVSLYESRLFELDERLDTNQISQSEYLALKKELELDVLEMATKEQSEISINDQLQTASSYLNVKYFSMLMLPLVIVVTFLFLTSPESKKAAEWENLKSVWQFDIEQYFSQSKDLPSEKGDLDAQSFLLLAQNYLQKKPLDHAAWLEIGLLHLRHGSAKQSLKYITNALEIDSDNAAYRLVYAQALVAIGSKENLKQSVSLLNEVFKKTPHNEMALMVYAIANQKLENYSVAVDAWKKLKQLKELGGVTSSPVIEEYLSKAEASLKGVSKQSITEKITNAEPARDEVVELKVESTVETSNQASPLFRVRVEAPSNVDNKLEKGILFVIVKFDDRPMPVAVKRIRGAQLPVNVSFSDGDSLMQQSLLSDAIKMSQSKLQVLGRYSFNGVAAATSGDYYSKSMNYKEKGLTVTLDQQVK